MNDITHEPLAHDDVGDGPPLVLLHGLTFSRHTWDPIVERLRDRFRCITVDLPGHGDSAGSAAEPLRVVGRLRATLDTLADEAPLVIGHSAGAVLAAGYASRFPVAGVVDVDQPMLVGEFAALLQRLAPGLRGAGFATTFAPFEESIGVHLLPEPERSRVTDTRRICQEIVLDHWTLPMTSAPSEAQATVDRLLDGISSRFLYFGGTEPAPPVLAHLRAHIDDLEVVVWPGRGHLVHLAEPDLFAEAVADFRGRVSVPGRAESPTAASARGGR